MVIREAISDIAGRLSDNAIFEATQIVMYVTDLDNTGIILHSRDELPQNKYCMASEMVQRRLSGEPLQYILGFTEFMGLRFEVNTDVLIPRADTEVLVEEVLQKINGEKKSVLDIGSGSGCIGISIAHFEKQTDVTFLDISKSALDTAKMNAEKNNVSGKFINMDILEEYPQEKYDIVVSNPPYIRPDVISGLQTEVRDFEPYIALNGGNDGLVFYRRIINIAPHILNADGILAFEIGYDQGNDVKELMREGFYNVELKQDLCGNDRVVTGKILKNLQ